MPAYLERWIIRPIILTALFKDTSSQYSKLGGQRRITRAGVPRQGVRATQKSLLVVLEQGRQRLFLAFSAQPSLYVWGCPGPPADVFAARLKFG